MMACLDTYKNKSDQKGQFPPMSPRLSFSNDFVESSNNPSPTNTTNNIQDPKILSNTPPSDDFEFSPNPTNHTAMTAADQLFFKGKLLPTLGDELLIDDDEDIAPVPPKSGLPKWKEFLSLKRSVVDGRCTATDNNKNIDANQGKIPKLALYDNSSSHLPITS
uniref:Uncharacterized protein n=2 Tax=Cucumis melo TaxID=3656 RepID=A0A9I9CS68_CUCME